MRIAFLQTEPLRGDPERNLGIVGEALRGADADLVVLPELATTGYLFRDREQALRLASDVPGRDTEALQASCARGGFHVVCGIAERAGAGGGEARLYNSAVIVGPRGPVGVYRKSHLFGLEKRIFDPGDSGFAVHDVAGVRLGVLVCFDWIFPEAARTLALAGAEVVAHPSNLVLPWAQDAVVTRCIENRVFWILANRTGSEHEGETSMHFTGRSRITGPEGTVMAEALQQAPCLVTAEIDPSRARSKRVGVHNDLMADRRPDLYEL